MKSNKPNLVIFFDGVCGLCNGFVDFIMKIDTKGIFRFSPLQSGFAAQQLPPQYIQDLNSVVVMIDGKVYSKARAVFAVFKQLGGKWKILSAVGVLPLGFLNYGYDLVATHRYKLFGKKETCRLPSAAERERFLL
jgi:predicted DCC family thiol-disulfide oxidoreductase YuxK